MKNKTNSRGGEVRRSGKAIKLEKVPRTGEQMAIKREDWELGRKACDD